MKLVKTDMMTRYLVKFCIRIIIYLTILFIYIFDRELLLKLVTTPIHYGVTPLHILWLIFIVMMLIHLFPRKSFTMALLKAQEDTYEPVETYDELELYKYIQNKNYKAWIVMLLWICVNIVFGMLYAFKVMDEADLFMLTVFYFLCDYICILIYCPFQSHIMKNKCCVNCRIFDWGHFMMFLPMVFIQSFFTWSLFFLSCIVLIRWELTYARHPERFWSGSNKRLQCHNCKDKTCQIKNGIKSKFVK